MAKQDDIRKNGSGYFDPTAYEAIRNIRQSEKKRLNKEALGSSYFIARKGRKEKNMEEKLLEIVTEEFDEEQAKKELAGMEEEFKGKLTDGIGEDLGEIIPEPDEEEEGGER